MSSLQALKSYQNTDLEAAVASASAVGLVVMLYDGALTAITLAKSAMQQKQYDQKSQYISKAVNIVAGLRETLNLEQASEVGRNLNDLYLYMEEGLMKAGLKNDTTLLDEAHRLLSEIKPAWTELAKTYSQSAPRHAAQGSMTSLSLGKV